MRKKLFLAPAASGKSKAMLDLARLRAGSLQMEVRVCVPTGLQAHAWRQGLAAGGGAIGVYVLTFDRLVATCLDVAGEAYTELSEAVQYRLLRTIVDQLPLDHYAPLKRKPGFIQVTQQVIGELKARLVNPPDFAEAVVALGNEPRLRELAAIYTAYQDRLLSQGWADRAGLHWLAFEALDERAADACCDWPLLIVDGFDDFTPSQLALLRLLAGRVDEFCITLPQVEGVDYPRYRSTRQEVEQALGISGAALPDPSEAKRHATLRYLARHLFALSASEPVPAGEALMLREAPDRVAEVRTALRWLKQRIVHDGLAVDQVALLARDITPYRAFIQQIATEFGLPMRLVDGLPLGQNPVIAALLELLRLYLPLGKGGEPTLPRRQVISAWRSPYFSWKNSDSTISSADADTLDNLARQQRVIRGLAQWEAAFIAGSMAKDADANDDEGGSALLRGTAVQQLHDKFTHFCSMIKPPGDATTMRAFVRWLETLIGPDRQAPGSSSMSSASLQIIGQAQSNRETAEADVAALHSLKDILRGMVWGEEALGKTDPVDFISFLNELSGAIAASSFKLPLRAGQPEILVSSVTQVRGLSFQAVAVMGLSEGSFPATVSEDPFLRDVDRERLHRHSHFLLEPSTQSSERELFYDAITRPRQKLLLTRPVLAENGAEWVASPFWEATQQLVGCTPESIASEAVLPFAETASKSEWWETMASYAAGTEEVQKQDLIIWQKIETGAQIWQVRLAAQPSIWEGELRAMSPELAAQHGPEAMWSASRLESYQMCGFLFFLRHILKLSPRPEPVEGLDARQLGTLYHRILERMSKSGEADATDERAVWEIVTAVAGPILDAAPEKEGFRATPWWAHTRQEIVDNVVQSVMALAADDYEFLQAECSFGFKGTPLVLEDGDDKLQLRGFIDRVDRNDAGQLRIVDYKLGGPYAYTARAFAEGEKLQLPLYALAAQEALRLGPVVDGFYWHYQKGERSSFQLAKANGGVSGAIETAVAHSWEAVHRIRDGQLTPRPPDSGCPAYCPAAGFCWQYTASAW